METVSSLNIDIDLIIYADENYKPFLILIGRNLDEDVCMFL